MSNAARLVLKKKTTIIVTSSSDLILVLEFCRMEKQLYFLGHRLLLVNEINSVKEREDSHTASK